MKRILSIGTLLALLAGAWYAPATAQDRMSLQPDSRLWIEGSSTVNDFTCAARTVQGYGHSSEGIGEAASDGAGGQVQVEVIVPVRRFDCGNRRMNADFYEALKAEDFPVIRYELVGAEVIRAEKATENVYRLRIRGRLSIAGSERPIELIVLGRQLPDGRYSVRGSQAVLMTDFGVRPPTALGGLIKAHDRITIHFDLIAAADRLQ